MTFETKAARLRRRLMDPSPVLVAGAHNGLSAQLVERAGFDAIWASGFEISASFAVPDANILTMAENLDVAKHIDRASVLPVIADCDNGYGNAINVIRTVEAYEREGIAAICIEDNIFPKRCSFYAGVKRELESIEEFAGKIRAAKAAQRSPDFMVIARTEALIAGWGMEEALRRGRAYADAGADMVLIHSKSSSPDEVMAFARAWDRAAPLVCVPTIYKDTTAQELASAGFRVVIYANHGLRAAIKAMREVLTTVRREQKAAAVEERIVSLEDVYDLVGVNRMKSQEKSFLPAGGEKVSAVILAAGKGDGLGELVADRPKAMLDIKGKTILERQVAALNALNVKDISVVRGYHAEAINLPNLKYYDNPHHETTGEAASLFTAAPALKGRVLVLYGDILFDKAIVEKLLQCEGDIAVLVDRAAHAEKGPKPSALDLVSLAGGAAASTHRFLPSDEPTQVTRIGQQVAEAEANAEFVGIAMLSPEGARKLVELYHAAEARAGERFHEAPSLAKASFTDLLQDAIEKGIKVVAIETYKGWMEVDTFEDYQRAWAQLRA